MCVCLKFANPLPSWTAALFYIPIFPKPHPQPLWVTLGLSNLLHPWAVNYVCVISYLLSRCMRPEGPWQRRAFFLHDHILSQTEMIGPSRVPLYPNPP